MHTAEQQTGAASRPPSTPWAILALWALLASVLLAGALLLLLASPLFEWQREVADMPAAMLGFGMAAVGLAYALLAPLIRTSLALEAAARRQLFLAAIGIGLATRALLFFSEPALEDDYHRYLWEGALSAHLISPYKLTPSEARRADAQSKVGKLAETGEIVVVRINHPDISSNYPPVAQAAFASAHLVGPWSLSVWRLFVLGFDVATMLLMVALLDAAARDRLWALLYWWNPIVIKELANSAHMDGLILMMALASLLLAARHRHFSALALAGLAVGAKLWPVLLIPLMLRPLLRKPVAFATGAALVVAVIAVVMLPVWHGAAAPNDGFVAYARHWRTNSAFFPAFEDLIASALAVLGRGDTAWIVARSLVGVGLVALALVTARHPITGTDDLMRRAGLVTLWLVLANPAQFPWYVVWTIPFAAFEPRSSVVAMTALVPLYYISFHMLSRGAYPVFSQVMVWVIWLPVWCAVAIDALKASAATCRSGPSV